MIDILKTHKEKVIKVASLFLVVALTPAAVFMVSNKSEVNETKNMETIKKEVRFKDLSNGEMTSMDEDEFLCGATAAEMPAEFELEALKAQVVAIRSYLYNKSDGLKNTLSLNSANGNFGISNFCFCSSEDRRKKFGNKYEEYEEKIKKAVEAVRGQYLEYNDKPALTLFFTSCYKATNSCESVFGGDYPYLISVESNEFDEEYIKNAHVSKASFNDCKKIKSEEMKKSLKSLFENKKDFKKAIKNIKPSDWINKIKKSESGAVENLEVLGKKVTGHKFRMLLKLRSTNFDMKYNENDDEFEFKTKGFGHGAGMSQCGADRLAQEGKNYVEILSHYYPGTKLRKTETE